MGTIDSDCIAGPVNLIQGKDRGGSASTRSDSVMIVEA